MGYAYQLITINSRIHKILCWSIYRSQLISKVDDFHSTVDFVAFLTMTWEDSGLIISEDNNKEPVNHTLGDQISGTNYEEDGIFDLPQDWIDKLWLPDFYLAGLKEIKLVNFLKSYVCK